MPTLFIARVLPHSWGESFCTLFVFQISSDHFQNCFALSVLEYRIGELYRHPIPDHRFVDVIIHGGKVFFRESNLIDLFRSISVAWRRQKNPSISFQAFRPLFAQN
jgi:hypothetical protein